MSSVDDFIRELEAKEKDLHITADLRIEIQQSEFECPVDREPAVIEPPPATMKQTNSPVSSPRSAASSTPVAPGMKTRVFELENEVNSLQERVRSLIGERNQIQEKSDRRLKDFESYKYRMDRERRGAFIDQIANLAGAMLPVVDNLDRALASVNKDQIVETREFQQFYDGIALVNQQVNEVLCEMGVEPIKSTGETFDPLFHEAVATEYRADVPNNTVAEEMLRGYRIGNRVIRHSMVKVTQGGKPAASPYSEQTADANSVEPAE
jgi:molecular chaperone GrpE